MDYAEAAAQLGEAIAESGEFEAWRKAEDALLLDDRAQQMMQEFKDLQMEMVKASREDLEKEKLEEIRNRLLDKQRELNAYEVTNAYFEGKKGFENMMKTINDIIQHFVTGGQSGCSGSCSSCSGCH